MSGKSRGWGSVLRELRKRRATSTRSGQRECCACVRPLAAPVRCSSRVQKGRGRVSAPEEGWLGGARRRRWYLRARARVRTGNAARARLGRAVDTTDGDYGHDSGWWSGSSSRRRGCRGCGGGLRVGRVPEEGRGPGQQVLGEPGHGVPARFGASLAGQALQEGGFARARGDRGATRRRLMVAARFASLGPPLPLPRAPRGTTKAGSALATPPWATLGTRRPGPAAGSLGPTHSRGKPQLARSYMQKRWSWTESQSVRFCSFVSCLRCVNKELILIKVS